MESEPLLSGSVQRIQVLSELLSLLLNDSLVLVTSDHVDLSERLVQEVLKVLLGTKHVDSFLILVAVVHEVEVEPLLLQVGKSYLELVLTSGSHRNGHNLFLVLDHIEVDQGLEGESFLVDVQFTILNEIVDSIHVLLVQYWVSESLHNRHGSLECLNKVFEFILDWIWRQDLDDSVGDLLVLVGLLADIISLDLGKESLLVAFLESLPLIKGVPHQVTVGQTLSQIFNVLKVSLVCAELFLPAIVLDGCLFELLESVHLFIELLDHLVLVRCLVEILWELTLLNKGVHLLTELWNELLKLLLESLSLGLLLGFDLSNDLGEFGDLFGSVLDRILVLFLDLT